MSDAPSPSPVPNAAVPVQLSGIGHYFPGDPITNEYFEGLPDLDVDDAWIREHTGVESRHWAGPGERFAEMGVKAARLALKDACLEASDIDVVIGTSATARPRVNPSSMGNNYMDISLPVQRQLGAHDAFCFDVTSVACAGFLYASVVARGLLATMGLRNALVVCAESPKAILNFRYKNSALFGAGAAAAVWTVPEDGRNGMLDVALRADGRYYDAFDIDEQDKMVMRGGVLGEVTPGMLIDAGETVLKRNDLTADQIAWCVPHQANANLLYPVAQHLGIPRERVLLNLPSRGNTSSVGMPGTLSEFVHNGTVQPGELLLGVSIGRGISWGAMLFTYR
ncbi:3-oxoacyl-ACP synthase III family protein [Streptomyces sp. H27-D2]|uniref:3-oxoacyl-ACP synthase III family protein n=1 Tax=Streptomyces sp. H27-D2 TaxID=3046304 RepID=UPI002DB8218D|nr:ketoacyl-ACP synthase III [Streptomyces sp. H27-D2]MEC4019143.1 ketoacyl-ACP synthase III [Streptomyces sp. H27-D2]